MYYNFSRKFGKNVEEQRSMRLQRGQGAEDTPSPESGEIVKNVGEKARKTCKFYKMFRNHTRNFDFLKPF